MARPAWFAANARRKKQKNIKKHRTVVAKSAVSEFMNREREDYRWIKELSWWKLRQYVYNEWNAFHTKPRIAQLASFAIGMERPRFLFNLDMGLGKSKVALDLFRYHKLKNSVKRMAVLVPNIVNIESWADQCITHAPDLVFEKLIGNRNKRHKLINERADVFLLNYGGLQSYMTEIAEVEHTLYGKKKIKTGRVINRSAADSFSNLFDMVAFDEIHTLGSHDSLVFRECDRLSKSCEFCYGFTGTLFGRDPGMMWPQFKIVDRGYTLGETLGLYRAGFFEEVEHKYKAFDFKFIEDRADTLHEFLQHSSLRYTKEECIDMPPLSRIPVPLAWSDEGLLYHENLLADCKAKGMEGLRLNPNTYILMRQITSGYVGYETDNGKAKLVFDVNPKLDWHLGLIDQIPIGDKLVIYHEYQFTGQLIRDALAKRKINHAELWGKTKNPAAQLRKFLDDPTCCVMVAQYVSGGTGNNYQEVANYVSFYESPPGPIRRKQSEERVYRPGQPKKVFIYDPCLVNSIDVRIQEALLDGVDLYKAICDGKRIKWG